MATKQTAEETTAAQPAPAPSAPAPTPSQGGSYLLDDETGEHTLIERTQPKEQP